MIKISAVKKYWNDHKIIQWLALWGLIAIFIIRICSVYAVFSKPPISIYFVDFFHSLMHVEYFVSGQDYAQMATDPLYPELPDYNFAPVFPGATFFFLPFIPLNKTVVQGLVVFFNILFPFILAMLVARILKLPATWQFWRPSKEAFSIVILFLVIFFSRPALGSQINGQVSIIVTFLVFYSVFYGSGIAWGAATVLKFTTTPLYFFQFPLSKRYGVMLKALGALAFFLIFPIIFQPNLWKLYHGFAIKVSNHFHAINRDSYEGCGIVCWTLTEMAWIKNGVINLLVKAFSLILFFYACWKNWGKKGIGIHTLLLTGAVTLIIVYHRFYDGLLVVIPLLLLMIIYFQQKQWKLLVFPSLIYAYYLMPGKLWTLTSIFVGSLFKNSSEVYPGIADNFPLDSIVCLVLIFYATKKIWCDQEVYIYKT